MNIRLIKFANSGTDSSIKGLQSERQLNANLAAPPLDPISVPGAAYVSEIRNNSEPLWLCQHGVSRTSFFPRPD